MTAPELSGRLGRGDLLGALPSLELPPLLNDLDAGGDFGASDEDTHDEDSRYSDAGYSDAGYSDAGYSDAHLHDDPYRYRYMPPELRPSSQSSTVLPAVPVFVIGRSMFETSGIPSDCAVALFERAPRALQPLAQPSPPPPPRLAAAARPRTERVPDHGDLRRLKMRPRPHLAR